MSTPLQTTDDAVDRVRRALEEQFQSMASADQAIRQIRNEVLYGFRAYAGTTFTTKLQDWTTRYEEVQRAYREFHDRLGQGHALINRRHDEAVQLAAAFNPGSEVAIALSGQ
ncbi:hypothetical protein KNE206_57030 [Kitasatospora sp. NE20-6]|uniref:hypothetical protein n=1 Tax=Kitasatospora sp. NE20-6 TaxID=2859066 RepID=UPI0034DBB66D